MTHTVALVTPTLRLQVREFLERQAADGCFTPGINTWLGGFDPGFSAALGRAGWIGMTWPREYGGGGRSVLDRFVVVEELLAAGAPVAAHWFGDRQVGPSLMRHGTRAQRERFLPAIAAGRCFFAIGMSEPEAGSDLAAVRTRATRTDTGWRISGTKLWSSGAHRCKYLLALVRTGPERHDGLTQVIVDLSSPGVSIRPIRDLVGEHHFNEVVLDDVFVPDDGVLGRPGSGWSQVNAELANERSGPERFLSVMLLLETFLRVARATQDVDTVETVGRLAAQLWTLRELSLRVAADLDAGAVPEVEAALVKDLGTRFEQAAVESVRRAAVGVDDELDRLLWEATLHSPAFTLRGGTTEVLRIILNRGL